MRYAVLLALVTGCVVAPGQPTHHDGQDDAVALAWGIYGRVDEPPEVLWVEGDDLDCGTPTCPRCGFTGPAGCRGGTTMGPGTISVAWPDPEFHVDALALLPHELLHAALWRDCRVLNSGWAHASSPNCGDSYHRGPEWTTLLPAALTAVRALMESSSSAP